MKILGQLCHFFRQRPKTRFWRGGSIAPTFNMKKKMKKFDLNQKLPQNREIPLELGEKTRRVIVTVVTSRHVTPPPYFEGFLVF